MATHPPTPPRQILRKSLIDSRLRDVYLMSTPCLLDTFIGRCPASPSATPWQAPLGAVPSEPPTPTTKPEIRSPNQTRNPNAQRDSPPRRSQRRSRVLSCFRPAMIPNKHRPSSAGMKRLAFRTEWGLNRQVARPLGGAPGTPRGYLRGGGEVSRSPDRQMHALAYSVKQPRLDESRGCPAGVARQLMERRRSCLAGLAHHGWFACGFSRPRIRSPIGNRPTLVELAPDSLTLFHGHEDDLAASRSPRRDCNT